MKIFSTFFDSCLFWFKFYVSLKNVKKKVNRTEETREKKDEIKKIFSQRDSAKNRRKHSESFENISNIWTLPLNFMLLNILQICWTTENVLRVNESKFTGLFDIVHSTTSKHDRFESRLCRAHVTVISRIHSCNQTYRKSFLSLHHHCSTRI